MNSRQLPTENLVEVISDLLKKVSTADLFKIVKKLDTDTLENLGHLVNVEFLERDPTYAQDMLSLEDNILETDDNDQTDCL